MDKYTSHHPAVRILGGVDRTAAIHELAYGTGLLGLGFIAEPNGTSTETAVYWGVVVGSVVALSLRRRAPVVSAAGMTSLLALHGVVVGSIEVFAAALCLVVAHTSQTCIRDGRRWLFLGLVYLGALSVLVPRPDDGVPPDFRSRAVLLALGWALITLVALWGVMRRHQRDMAQSALERAHLLAVQRDNERQLAIAEERALVAREVHDILGHSLNTIAVQAEGARYAIRSDLDAADRAMATIGRLSRDSVDELRGVIAALRAEDGGQQPVLESAMERLEGLVESFRRAGVQVTVESSAERQRLPSLVSRAVYRIVQEGLTNSMKHAPGAPVVVSVVTQARHVHVSLVNEISRNAPRSADPGAHGHGLVGMEERVRSLGGRLTAGLSDDRSRWRIIAELPWSAT